MYVYDQVAMAMSSRMPNVANRGAIMLEESHPTDTFGERSSSWFLTMEVIDVPK